MLYTLLATVPLLATGAAGAQTAADVERAQAAGYIIPTNGPATLALPGGASLMIPKGYAFLRPEDAARVLSPAQHPGDNYYVVWATEGTWNLYVAYHDTGNVRDTDAIDPRLVMKAIRDHEQRVASSGGPWQSTTGWAQPLRYSTKERRLDIATRLETPVGPHWTHETNILGRRGYFKLVLVADGDYQQAKAVFDQLLGGFVISSGHRYEDFRTGDPVAPWGVGALAGL